MFVSVSACVCVCVCVLLCVRKLAHVRVCRCVERVRLGAGPVKHAVEMGRPISRAQWGILYSKAPYPWRPTRSGPLFGFLPSSSSSSAGEDKPPETAGGTGSNRQLCLDVYLLLFYDCRTATIGK